MKIPSLQTTQGAVALIVVGFVGYVVYKSYKTGTSIAAGITDKAREIGDVFTGVSNEIDLAFTKVGAKGRSVIGTPIDSSDQSAAETARLKRQANPVVDISDYVNPDGTSYQNVYDAMEGYVGADAGLGTDTITAALSQDYSPDAMGLA